jgi:hypothetical protein
MGEPMDKDKMRFFLDLCTKDDLIILRAMISGRLGKRKISTEAQSKMQAGRRKKSE